MSDGLGIRDDSGTRSGAPDPQRPAALHIAAQSPAVEWRSTAKGLWLGRSGGHRTGPIELVRGDAVTDADGRRRGSYRSPNAAVTSTFTDDADRGFAGESAAGVAPAWEGIALATTIIGAATVLLSAYALTLL